MIRTNGQDGPRVKVLTRPGLPHPAAIHLARRGLGASQTAARSFRVHELSQQPAVLLLGNLI